MERPGWNVMAMPRQWTISSWMNVCVDPESTKAQSVVPPMLTRSCIVLAPKRPINTWRDTHVLSHGLQVFLIIKLHDEHTLHWADVIQGEEFFRAEITFAFLALVGEFFRGEMAKLGPSRWCCRHGRRARRRRLRWPLGAAHRLEPWTLLPAAVAALAGTPLKGAHQAHSILQIGRPLHFHVLAHRLAQAGGEQIHLVLRGKAVTATKEWEELVLIVIHGASAVQFLQFPQGVGPDGRPKAKVDKLSEAKPRKKPIFFHKRVVPFGDNIVEMQGCQPNLFRGHCPGAAEIRLTSVQPWLEISWAIVARKAELRSVEGVAEVGMIVVVVVGPEGSVSSDPGAASSARAMAGAAMALNA
jgi:hypothetical protein